VRPKSNTTPPMATINCPLIFLIHSALGRLGRSSHRPRAVSHTEGRLHILETARRAALARRGSIHRDSAEKGTTDRQVAPAV
jgi:hypothetical protein